MTGLLSKLRSITTHVYMHACIYLCVLFVNIYIYIYIHPSIYLSVLQFFFFFFFFLTHGLVLDRAGSLNQSMDRPFLFCLFCLFVCRLKRYVLSIYLSHRSCRRGRGGEEGAVRIHLSVHCERVGRLSFKRTDRGESVYDDDNKERGGVWGGSEINFFKKKKKERKKEKGGGSSFHDFVVV